MKITPHGRKGRGQRLDELKEAAKMRLQANGVAGASRAGADGADPNAAAGQARAEPGPASEGAPIVLSLSSGLSLKLNPRLCS